MACAVCLNFSFAPRKDGDCFEHLMDMLKAHYRDREERKNKEIRELKERLYRLEAPRDHSTTSISSPTLFTQELFGDPPHSISTDIFNSTTTDQDVEFKEPLREIQRQNRPPKKSPLTAPSGSSPFKSPIRNGGKWKSKPTRLSFSNLKLETQSACLPPKKQMKALTIQESFNRGTTKPVRTAETKKRSIESVDLEDDEGTAFHTPPKTITVKADPNEQGSVLNTVNLEAQGFCEDCAEYFRLNPPYLTKKEKEAKLQDCEKHKLKKYKMHETPPGFWKVDFGPTPEQMKTQVVRK